ncbi:uncharacterized protein TrAFT101_002747 [Trichoderma asperellum]|uniref:uncharacterized protein n=1 Tax=Trichoderma asperellum TaxID=101201 RepID=UPI00331C4959|nr:hypothetical protein TrAFT101_002747 [Trichoderma asperellum]
MNDNSAEFRKSPTTLTCQTYPLPNQALLTGGCDDASIDQQRKLFAGDRGLPRSTSIQASQIWPITAQDDSAALIHQCMTSCPDFNRSSRQPGIISPRPGSWQQYYSRRVSRSQPITPPGFRERIAVRFRRRRPWESPRRSRNSTSTELVMPRFQDGRERRRRARGSLERHSPSDIGSPGQGTPVGE